MTIFERKKKSSSKLKLTSHSSQHSKAENLVHYLCQDYRNTDITKLFPSGSVVVILLFYNEQFNKATRISFNGCVLRAIKYKGAKCPF